MRQTREAPAKPIRCHPGVHGEGSKKKFYVEDTIAIDRVTVNDLAAMSPSAWRIIWRAALLRETSRPGSSPDSPRAKSVRFLLETEGGRP
jgi:hypothetical protein